MLDAATELLRLQRLIYTCSFLDLDADHECRGLCPDEDTGYDNRDPDCLACAALDFPTPAALQAGGDA